MQATKNKKLTAMDQVKPFDLEPLMQACKAADGEATGCLEKSQVKESLTNKPASCLLFLF